LGRGGRVGLVTRYEKGEHLAGTHCAVQIERKDLRGNHLLGSGLEKRANLKRRGKSTARIQTKTQMRATKRVKVITLTNWEGGIGKPTGMPFFSERQPGGN